MTASDGDVLVCVDSHAGRLRLNRPAALHALTTQMCGTMLSALDAWHDDPDVQLVLLDHATGRGFCAGGDIRMLAASGAGDGAEARAFFHLEYQLNHRLFSYAKPTVAVMDGITMGGGVGLALPCRYRIATENVRFAMPETGIGLFPDVGAGWYLSRLPSRIGQYLALTGARLDGADCRALRLATHFVPSALIGSVKMALAERPWEAEAILADAGGNPAPTPVFDLATEIDRLFASDRLEDTLTALAQDSGDFAKATLAILRTKSPRSMKVGLRLLSEARSAPSFEDEMRREYAVACSMVRAHDFLEGVRAVIVEKDGAPRWSPSTAEGVDDDIVDGIFAPLVGDDAWMPAGRMEAVVKRPIDGWTGT